MKTVLVWGAARPEDDGAGLPLYPTAVVTAYDLRLAVREAISQDFSSSDKTAVSVIFSEEGDTHGHLRENPGLYEPQQLENCEAVVLVFPSHRPVAVTTWETALVFSPTDTAQALSDRPASQSILVVPQTMCDYWRQLMLVEPRVIDPKDHQFHPPSSEPLLHAAGSFAARLIYKEYVASFYQAASLQQRPEFPNVVSYPDKGQWNLQDEEGLIVIAKILDAMHGLLDRGS